MLACFEGLLKAIPPSLAGSEKRFRSGLLGGGLPVRAGISEWRILSSNGCRSGPIPEIVLDR